jgi:phage host-nuclease inhibitor protein Gam
MPKAKKPAPMFIMIGTDDEFAAAANLYVEKSIELEKRKAALDAKIAALNSEFDRDNAELIAETAVLVGSVHLYAEANRAALFADTAEDGPRSVTVRNATVGFRWNPHRVGKIASKDNFETIAKRLAATEWGAAYAKETYELDKAALLKDRGEFTPAQLKHVGIAFERDETFFITPALESARPVAVAAAA